MKKIIAVLMTLILCLGTILPIATTVSAASLKVYHINLPRSADPNKAGWGHPALTFLNGWKTGEVDSFQTKSLGSYEGNSAYCIEPGIPLATGDSLIQKGEDFWEDYPSDYNQTISSDYIKKHIGRILQYGWTGKNNLNWDSRNNVHAEEIANQIATQILIWETIVGERDIEFKKVDAHAFGKSNMLDMISNQHPLRDQVFSHYNRIVSSVISHGKLPSFFTRNSSNATVHELDFDGNNYTKTLTDTNNVLLNYTFSSSTSGVSFSVSGNKLTISMKTAPTGVIDITATKPNGKRKATILWTDGIVSNNGSGQIQDLVTYGAEASDPITGYLKVKVNYGDIKLIKTSEIVKETVHPIFPPYWVYGFLDNFNKYVVPSKQTTKILWDEVTNKTFHNVLKKFRVTVTKSDSELGLPQGDATLSGAVYGIYKGNQLVDRYTTDSNGQFTTKYYICGDDWTIREITPSEGYLIDTVSHPIGAEAKLYSVEYNATANDVSEIVKKGTVSIVKHCDDGSTQIETPEVGAEFEVYLKSSGSYLNAKETERDILTCDENGFAISKKLPYGTYTIHQTKGWDGREKIHDFDVVISENYKNYPFIINNATFKALIQIIKKDTETGKVITAGGIGFKVKDVQSGKFITQHINYPTPMDIDTFYTDTTGKFMLPEKLSYGSYELIEVQTAHGYVLSKEPVPFKVDGSETVVTVEKYNTPQKGVIVIEKQGEIFSSVIQNNGTYTPQYAPSGLGGAIYEITAKEDIYTLDGTLRYAKGTIVDRITTDKIGLARSKQLYLGKYEVREMKAPIGMVVNNKIYEIELNYAGQEVAIAEVSASFYNERQKVQIDLQKVLEQDDRFHVGKNGEIFNVSFGLYATENIVAADGSIIPKGGLVEVASCDEKKQVSFQADIPMGKYYVKEYTTDHHYIISDKEYPVLFEYEGQDIAVVTIKVNDEKPIENKLIKGSIHGLKVDEDGVTIDGALFGLFKADETNFTNETAILTSKSNEIGVFGFKNIPFGDYIVREISPKEGFVLK